MEEPEVDYGDIMRDVFKYERKRALKAFFEKGAMDWDIKDMNFCSKWFYWAKALFCVLFKKFGGGKYQIAVLSYDEYHYPESIGWTAVWISPGLFKGWSVTIGSDGT